MSTYRSSSRANVTYYSYASRVLTTRPSRTVGVVGWCALVAGTILARCVPHPEWLDWAFLPSYAVWLAVVAWRWRLRRRMHARAGFRESSPVMDQGSLDCSLARHDRPHDSAQRSMPPHRSSRRVGTFAWCVVLLSGMLLCLTPGLPSWLGGIVIPSFLVLLCAGAWRWR